MEGLSSTLSRSLYTSLGQTRVRPMPQTPVPTGAMPFVSCKRKPERERNAEMAGTGPPAQHGFGIAWAQGSTKFDGQYRGELTLTKIINGDCTQPPLGAVYPLTKSRGEVRFVYVPDSTP